MNQDRMPPEARAIAIRLALRRNALRSELLTVDAALDRLDRAYLDDHVSTAVRSHALTEAQRVLGDYEAPKRMGWGA